MSTTRPFVLLAALMAALTLACGDEGGPAQTTTASPGPATAVASDGAVRVPEGYAAPQGRVPSTGANIPVNGKPTLVFVDAIW